MSRKRIQIVDDNPVTTRMVRRGLELTNDFIVFESNDSTHALEQAKQFQPDLMILDLQMPEVDGGLVARALLCEDQLADTPVMFMTGSIRKSEEGSAKDLTGYTTLAKPVPLTRLIETIRQELH
jgi:two-component system cell cycle response regulator DivK